MTTIEDGTLREVLARHPPVRESLIPMLQEFQGRCGYVPREAVRGIAGRLGVSESEVYGVATFYAQFTFQPGGRHLVRVCRGTACHVKGSKRIMEVVSERLRIAPGQTTADRRFSLVSVACFGSCALSPAVMVDGRVYGRVTPETVEKILEEYP